MTDYSKPLTSTDAAKLLGIGLTTLVKSDLKPSFMTPKGHRRYTLADVLRYKETLAAKAKVIA